MTAASTRFRAAQFFPYLRRMGIECTLSPFLSDEEFRRLYDRGAPAVVAARLLAAAIRRVAGVLRSRSFDVVVVQRGSMLVGPPIIERMIAGPLRRPLVFDFDDAIWLADPASAWGRWTTRLKSPRKTAEIIRIARHVVVCNEYTRTYARGYRAERDVTVIPTVVDEAEYRSAPAARQGPPVVGWIGTHSTAIYLEAVRGALERAAARHSFRVRIVGAGRPFRPSGVEVENKAWRLEDEVSDYQSLDIGLYPVADDEWGRGKTGFKPVVYMSCGVACVASPIGGVTEFLRHGENGLFATSDAEWERAIGDLVSDPGLRRRLAAAGRRTVEQRYCLSVQAPRLAEVLRASA
ncbi:MAG: glycosyltransferase family 4 protein [Elusimicrobia bacterium]|nr:glycosyltransferase family 4 protein [Elusimicrobiota bacterium]